MAPAPGEQLTEVCRRLDELLLRLMDDLEALQDKRERLNGLIEKGWFLISQSRYSMGNKFVSSLQYKQDMVSSVCVQDSTAEDGATSFCVERILDPGQRDEMKQDLRREVEDVGTADQVLRHRGTADTPKAEKDKKPSAAPPSHDPLRWFGVLVPQSLRQAQSTFRQGVALSAEVTSLQSSVDETRKQYGALMARKKRLQAQSG